MDEIRQYTNGLSVWISKAYDAKEVDQLTSMGVPRTLPDLSNHSPLVGRMRRIGPSMRPQSNSEKKSKNPVYDYEHNLESSFDANVCQTISSDDI
jgi:hypothetical protein